MDANPYQVDRRVMAFIERWSPKDRDERHFEGEFFGLVHAIHREAAEPFIKAMTASISLGAYNQCLQRGHSVDLSAPGVVDLKTGSQIPKARAWQNMDSAPRNGTVIEACARLPTASAGFPQYIEWTEGDWYTASYTRHKVVPWCWRPRENGWPHDARALGAEAHADG